MLSSDSEYPVNLFQPVRLGVGLGLGLGGYNLPVALDRDRSVTV